VRQSYLPGKATHQYDGRGSLCGIIGPAFATTDIDQVDCLRCIRINRAHNRRRYTLIYGNTQWPVDTLREAVDAWTHYRDTHRVGGRNQEHPITILTGTGTLYLSYNGRVWAHPTRSHHNKEIDVDLHDKADPQ